jgi:hypothetical protein
MLAPAPERGRSANRHRASGTLESQGSIALAFGGVKGKLASLVAFRRPLTPPLAHERLGFYGWLESETFQQARAPPSLARDDSTDWLGNPAWVSVPVPPARASRRKSLIRWQKRAAVLVHGFESRGHHPLQNDEPQPAVARQPSPRPECGARR